MDATIARRVVPEDKVTFRIGRLMGLLHVRLLEED